MLELAADLLPLLRDGTPVAAVTVSRVVQSAPRGVGATLAVTADARVIGSISGGCVEGDAVMLGLDALRSGTLRAARFGFAATTATTAAAADPACPVDPELPAGLACRGAVEVIAYPLRADAATLAALEDAVAGRETAVGIVTAGPDAGRVTASDEPALGNRMLEGAYDGWGMLVLHLAPPPPLLILGAGEHAAALCTVAAAAGFAVTVCDAWSLLVTAERFPAAAALVTALPHEYLATFDPARIDPRTAICVLTHDERLDVPALRVALGMPVAFVGAMGARATVARRRELLHRAGVTDQALARLHSPLGLDLGLSRSAATPGETALSVIAEIVAARHGGSARPLGELTGPVHTRSEAETGTASASASASAPAPAGHRR